MDILVIGGSYFLGKAFVELSKDTHNLTLINRGTRPLNDSKIKEYHIDRHDGETLEKAFSGKRFDAVVDFCAYNKGDIESFMANSKITTKQYIFISTCDVYRRDLGRIVTEDDAFEDRQFAGQEGAYITGKVALEHELKEVSKKYDTSVTSIRPAFIYGPDNYADREAIYFQWILKAGQILHPIDADGSFQMVYVKDAAKAILLSIENPQGKNRVFNLCMPQRLTYESFYEMLKKLFDEPFERVDITVDTVLQKQVPLPFPLLKEESQWYDTGRAVKELGLEYTDLLTGMKETLEWYKRNL